MSIVSRRIYTYPYFSSVKCSRLEDTCRFSFDFNVHFIIIIKMLHTLFNIRTVVRKEYYEGGNSLTLTFSLHKATFGPSKFNTCFFFSNMSIKRVSYPCVMFKNRLQYLRR